MAPVAPFRGHVSRGPTVAAAQGQGGRPASGMNSRIIMPGQQAPRQQGSGAKIILPSSGQRKPPPIPNGSGNFPELNDTIPDGMESAQTISPRNFKPPTGFMSEDGPMEDITIGKSTDELLSTLTSKSDYWYNLARIFPRLYIEGLTAPILEEMMDVSPARQSVWQVASEVYYTVRDSGALTKKELSVFNKEEMGPDCLIELRYLDVDRRVEGARYIAQQQLGPSDSVILARAIKEHERRADSNEGFTLSAADCLAFKYYRDAQETRNLEAVQRFVKMGLRTASSISAKAKLAELMDDFVEEEAAGPTLDLTIIRLNREEASFRVVPCAGVYGQVTANALKQAPKVGPGTAFSTFVAPTAGMTLAVLPRWNIVAVARHPVVLSVADASTIPEILQTTGSKKEKDNAKMRAQALIVVDLEFRSVSDKSFYVVTGDDGKLKLSPGSKDLQVVGKVLCVCMPPRRESSASESFEL